MITEDMPQFRELADALGDMLAVDRESVGRLGERVRARIKHPRPDSPWYYDQQLEHINPQIYPVVQFASAHFWRVGHIFNDHSVVLEQVSRTQPHLGAPALTLLRAMLEAAVSTCRVLDANINQEQRLARAMAVLVQGFQSPLKTQRERDGGRETDTVQRMRKEYLDKLPVFEALGFRFRFGKRSLVHEVEYGGETAKLTWEKSKAVADYFGRNHHLYTLLSGATHSEAWHITTRDTVPDEVSLLGVWKPYHVISNHYMHGICAYFHIDESANIRRRLEQYEEFEALCGHLGVEVEQSSESPRP